MRRTSSCNLVAFGNVGLLHGLPQQLRLHHRCVRHAFSQGVFASKHASKGIHLSAQAMRACPCWERWGGLLHRGLCLPSSESAL